MLPNNDNLKVDFQIKEIPSQTFKLDGDIISGTTDEIEAMKQAIILILNTERYKYPIYSWNYGVELQDLSGKGNSFIYPELKRRISEALLQDDRVSAVSGFEFTREKNKVCVTFTVTTIFGDINAEKVVTV